jgi:hypothetical protein
MFKSEGIEHLYKMPPGQLDDELFHAKVMNPETNTFYQISDLPLEYRKNLQNKIYPVREVYQIIRIKRLDSTEWLKSRGRIVGLNRLGNEVEPLFTECTITYLTRAQVKSLVRLPTLNSSKDHSTRCGRK